MKEKKEILTKISTENIIWMVYILLIFLSFYSNELEKEYILFDDRKAKENYRYLNIFIFSSALLIYFYFLFDSFMDMNNLKESDPFSKKHFTELNFLATLFVFLGGCILLYIALFDINLETEIALT